MRSGLGEPLLQTQTIGEHAGIIELANYENLSYSHQEKNMSINIYRYVIGLAEIHPFDGG